MAAAAASVMATLPGAVVDDSVRAAAAQRQQLGLLAANCQLYRPGERALYCRFGGQWAMECGV